MPNANMFDAIYDASPEELKKMNKVDCKEDLQNKIKAETTYLENKLIQTNRMMRDEKNKLCNSNIKLIVELASAKKNLEEAIKTIKAYNDEMFGV